MDNKQTIIIKRPRSKKRSILLLSAFFVWSAGVYILLLVAAPALTQSPLLPGFQHSTTPPPLQPAATPDRVYIPVAGISVGFAAGTESVLSDGLWHRYPERGNPTQGNFILAGHRFEMGFTPAHTARKSPLYSINKVRVGDAIYVDFKGKRYEYKVTKRYAVKPTEVAIEAPKEEAVLTLYTCTLGGEADGREVVEATLQQKSAG